MYYNYQMNWKYPVAVKTLLWQFNVMSSLWHNIFNHSPDDCNAWKIKVVKKVVIYSNVWYYILYIHTHVLHIFIKYICIYFYFNICIYYVYIIFIYICYIIYIYNIYACMYIYLYIVHYSLANLHKHPTKTKFIIETLTYSFNYHLTILLVLLN